MEKGTPFSSSQESSASVPMYVTDHKNAKRTLWPKRMKTRARSNRHTQKHRKQFLTVRMSKYWHSLPKKFVVSILVNTKNFSGLAPRQPILDSPALAGVKPGDLHKSFPTIRILWFCEDVCKYHMLIYEFSFCFQYKEQYYSQSLGCGQNFLAIHISVLTPRPNNGLKGIRFVRKS